MIEGLEGAPPEGYSTRAQSLTHSSDVSTHQNTRYEEGRITVSVRVRPHNSRETKLNTSSCIATLPAYNTLYIFPSGKSDQEVNALLLADANLRGTRHHRFTFDHVYPVDSTQEQVYEQIGRPVLHASFSGYHTCIFTYGQTGSGKSYCMMGPNGGCNMDDDPGIVPRLCRELFVDMDQRKQAAAARDEKVDFSVYVSYVEIYRERVRSLLAEVPDTNNFASAGEGPGLTPPGQVPVPIPRSTLPNASELAETTLRVREHPTLGVYVEGLAEIPVTSEKQVLRLMMKGNQRRHTASTRMNDTSSRSHAIFTLQLLQKRVRAAPLNEGSTVAPVVGDSAADVTMMSTQLGAKINLVDLAGSERAKSTGAEGETLKEGAQINKSLTTLGIVINALASQSSGTMCNAKLSTPRKATTVSKRHIPYRDSTLTFLLKESLGGNSKTFMIATVSPSTDSYEESLSTLRYADRAKSIVMKAFVNETAGDKRIRELEEEVKRLRDQIRSLLGAEATRFSVATTSAAARSDLVDESRSASPSSYAPDSDLSTAGDDLDDNHEGQVCPLMADMETVSSPGEKRRRQQRHVNPDAHAETVEGSPAPVQPDEEKYSVPPPAEFVETLHSELQRAEEMIRQMSAFEARRSAHIAQLVKQHEEEQAAMRATAVAAAPRESESCSGVTLSATMRLRREEPYLLNMDGAGDWVAAHLGSGETHVGVFPFDVSAVTETRKGRSRANSSDREDGGSHSASFDSSLDLSSHHGESEGNVHEEAPDRDPNVRYVHLPSEVSEGVGRPHCILECTKLMVSGTTATWATKLRAFPGHETHVIRHMNPNPLVVKGDGALALQSGDVLDIGTNHIQLKYIDPAESPATARGRRALHLENTVIVEHDDQTGDQPGRKLCVSPEAVPAASVMYYTKKAVGQESGITRTSDEYANKSRLAPALAFTESNFAESTETGTTPSCGDDVTHSAFEDEVDRGKSAAQHQDSETDTGESAKLPGVGNNAILEDTRPPSSSRPFIPSLNLGVALSANRLPLHSQTAAQQESTVMGASCEKSPVDAGESFSSTVLSEPVDPSISSSPSTQKVNPSSVSPSVSRGPQSTSASALRARLPIKRLPQTVHLNPNTALSSSDVHSIRDNASSNVSRSEAPPRFVGRYNLVLMGPTGSGKTSIVRNLQMDNPPWLHTAFSLLTSRIRANSADDGDSDSSGSGEAHPTIGIETTTLTSAGGPPVNLHIHELGGAPCFCPLLEELPYRRVTYLLCFPLHSGSSFVRLRGIVEDILCRTDSHTVSLVLVGTHAHQVRSGDGKGEPPGFFPRRLSVSQQAKLETKMEEVELQVVSLIQMLQPYSQLRPTVVGRFVVDNVCRQVYSTGYRAVEGFPEWLQWLGDLARDRCRADTDFVSGLVPARCLELGRQVGLMRERGKWCLSLRDFKTLASTVSSQYQVDEATSSTLARETLRTHVQLLSDWGVLAHRFRSAPLRQHVIIDVLWLRRLLTALTCCSLVAVTEPSGIKRDHVAVRLTGGNEQASVMSSPKEEAYRLMLTPQVMRFLDVVKVATADTMHLLPHGVVSLPVLAAMLETHLLPPASEAYTDSCGGKIQNTAAERRRSSITSSYQCPSTADVRYQIPLAGIVELLVLLDLIILGHKLLLSPCTGTTQSIRASSTRCASGASELSMTPASHENGMGLHSSSDPLDIDPEEESFVIYPLSCKSPASAGVTWLFPCFLSGPFYVFKLDMVPRNFFPKLICRLATVSDKIYLGPVGSQSCTKPIKRASKESLSGRGASGGVRSDMRCASDSCSAGGAAESSVLPRFSPYLNPKLAGNSSHDRDGLWFDAAWLLYRDAEKGDGVEQDSCRVLVRLVHHSVFLSFHCHQAAFSTGVGVGGASPGVQDFYDAVLESVRLVVEEFPGGKCSELMHCCADLSSLLEMEQRHPAVQSNVEAAALDRYVRFVSIDENLNSLERVLAKSGSALRTARTARRSHMSFSEDAEHQSSYIPLLRKFDTCSLDIAECLHLWRTEQHFDITAAIETQLVRVLENLSACYRVPSPSIINSCAALDELLDVLARIDTV